MMKSLLSVVLTAALSLSASAQDAAVAEFTLKPSPANPMMWDITELTVKAGQKVKLTIDNASAQPLPHNWVLVKPGKDAVVGNASLAMAADPTAMAKSYIPEASKADIIANTKLVQPNQKEVLEFTAPAEAGDYPYICTFPGHFLLMKGVLHVK
ncbi:MAG: Azurin [Verrucomicrobiaceae bacterium]|jgi:azurin|nr:Azurin [Verrucomicrobiaceae bacterium]